MPSSSPLTAAGLTTAATAAALALLASSGLAQTDATFSGLRALNLARNHAVKLNGGLGVYRPEGCMFSSEWGGSDCLRSRDAEGFRFRFRGGPPGWEQLGKPATVETEILIAPDGRSVVDVPYNGAPAAADQPTADPTPADPASTAPAATDAPPPPTN